MENKKQELTNNDSKSATVAGYTPLPDQLMMDLGFEKAEGKHFYDKDGWENKDIGIEFYYTPNKNDFWKTVATIYVNRGVDQIKQEFRELIDL